MSILVYFSLQEELCKKKIQKYDLDLKIIERKEMSSLQNKKPSDDEAIRLNEIRLEMLKIQINSITEKENSLKMKLEKNKNKIDISEIIEEERLIAEENEKSEDSLISNEENFEDANDNVEEFYEASMISTNKSSISNISIKIPESKSSLVQKDSVEIENTKKQLLDLSREKSSMRNKIVSFL